MSKFKWYRWTDENIEKLKSEVVKSTSMRSLLVNMGFKEGNGAYRRLKYALLKFDISTLHFTGKGWSKGKNIYNDSRMSKKPICEYFCAESLTGRSYIKKVIMQEKLITYKCSSCNIIDNWNGKSINLHLDHINGINNDNRLENLRFLCPNCHSQTRTYCSNVQNRYADSDIIKMSEGCSNIRQVMLKMNMTTGTNYNRLKKLLPHLIKKPFEETGDIIKIVNQGIKKTSSEYNGSNKSKEWVTKIGLSNRRVKDRPSKEDLSKMIENTPIAQIAKQYNVSDNAIRKWCKAYDLHMKPRGYWEKVKYSKV